MGCLFSEPWVQIKRRIYFIVRAESEQKVAFKLNKKKKKKDFVPFRTEVYSLTLSFELYERSYSAV